MIILSQRRSGNRILASSLHILRQSQLRQILRLFELRHELWEVLFFISILFPDFHKKYLNLPVCASNWTMTCFSLFKLSVPVRLRCIPAAARSHLLGSLVSGDLHARRYDPFRSITQLYDSLVLSFSLSSCSMVTSGMTWLLLVQWKVQHPSSTYGRQWGKISVYFLAHHRGPGPCVRITRHMVIPEEYKSLPLCSPHPPSHQNSAA